jgi:hypothetical protein
MDKTRQSSLTPHMIQHKAHQFNCIRMGLTRTTHNLSSMQAIIRALLIECLCVIFRWLCGIMEHLSFGIGHICGLDLNVTNLLVSAFSVFGFPVEDSSYYIPKLRDSKRNVIKAIRLATTIWASYSSSSEGILNSFLGKEFMNFGFYLQLCISAIFSLCVVPWNCHLLGTSWGIFGSRPLYKSQEDNQGVC